MQTTITFVAEDLGGENIQLDVKQSDTIGHAFSRYLKMLKCPPDHVSFAFAGKEVDVDRTFESYSLQGEPVLLIFVNTGTSGGATTATKPHPAITTTAATTTLTATTTTTSSTGTSPRLGLGSADVSLSRDYASSVCEREIDRLHDENDVLLERIRMLERMVESTQQPIGNIPASA